MALEEKEIQALAGAVESAMRKALTETITPLVESSGKVFGSVEDLKKDLIYKRDKAEGKAQSVESEYATLKQKYAELEANYNKQGDRFKADARFSEWLKRQGVIDTEAFKTLHGVNDAAYDALKWKEDGSPEYDIAPLKTKTPYLFTPTAEPEPEKIKPQPATIPPPKGDLAKPAEPETASQRYARMAGLGK